MHLGAYGEYVPAGGRRCAVALVRRAAVVGPQTSDELIHTAVGRVHVPPSGTLHMHHANDWADEAAVGVATVGGPPSSAPSADDAAAEPSPPASAVAILLALGLIAVGTTMAYLINLAGTVEPFRVGNQTTIFGILLVFAAAVERLLEPFTQRLPGRRAQAAYERAIVKVANGDRTTTLADVAAAKARVDRDRANRVVVVWGLATAVATVVCTGVGFFLLRALESDAHWDGVAQWIDGLVTGLIVGSGTKPLHDIVTRLQNSKEKAEDRP